jgi:hypothetical protein
MTHKLKPWTYNLIRVWMHPALGGIALFTLIGIVFNLVADPLAIIFVAYVLLWCVTTDILESLGWNRS